MGATTTSFAKESATYRDYVSTLPDYLSAFAEPQHYSRYTPENQAVWRFIMRQLTHFFETRAPQAYSQGLQRAAIPVERIPRIEEMVESLGKIGWGALCVNGFIPPAAFMEYNANRILPISADMRTLKHLLYTPAPDIVHEAAGHAPIVVDPEYTDFLQKVGEYGSKALSSQYDKRVYEAIRKLSIVKEYPHSTEREIADVQEELNEAVAERAKHPRSEAALVSRFHWWTVEYGLLQKPGEVTQMYGAGLLSSLGESRDCLGDEVEKVKLSIECIDVDYDITTPQPQLFYVESSKDLFPILEELADGMAFRIGGAKALERAINCACLATAVYDSGLQVSGVWSKCTRDENGEAIYIGTTGPTSLAYKDAQLEGHGEDYHTHGFSPPVGRLTQTSRPLSQLGYQELQTMGVERGKKSRLEFASGVVVEGMLRDIMSRDGINVLMSFTDCLVKGPQGEILFQPDWGTYDMAVGETIASVFGGPADKSNYDFIKQKSDYRNLSLEYDDREQKVFALYEDIRRGREEGQRDLDELQDLCARADALAPDNWLLRIELLELLKSGGEQSHQLEQKVLNDLEALKAQGPDVKHLITLGIDLAHHQ